jgi:hypothetical protein
VWHLERDVSNITSVTVEILFKNLKSRDSSNRSHQKSYVTRAYPNLMRSSLFWYVTQRRLAVTDVSGHIGPILKGKYRICAALESQKFEELVLHRGETLKTRIPQFVFVTYRGFHTCYMPHQLNPPYPDNSNTISWAVHTLRSLGSRSFLQFPVSFSLRENTLCNRNLALLSHSVITKCKREPRRVNQHPTPPTSISS